MVHHSNLCSATSAHRHYHRFLAPGIPPRAWTHPCTCTLIAHESCLLRWIQSSQSTRSRASNALKCPQCGTTYELTSSNPFLLRWLDMGNKGLSMIGRVVSVGSLTVVVVSLGTGACPTLIPSKSRSCLVQECIYSVLHTERMPCVNSLEQSGWLRCSVSLAMLTPPDVRMFDILLTDDPSNWPWHSFINLPLIPLALIFSRLPPKSNVTPLIPLLLAWPTSTPVAGDALNRLGTASNTGNAPPNGQSGKDLFPLLPHWPPPPFVLGLFVFPIVREGYRRLFSQFTKWVLGSTAGSGGEHGQAQRGERDMHRILMGAVAEDEPFLRIRVNAHVEEEEGAVPPHRDPRQGQGPGNNGNAAHGDDADDDAGDAAAAAENTIRVSGTSFGRLIGGALIIPRISSLMGSLLFWLSKRSTWLRAFLAVRPPLRAARRMGPLGLTTGIGRGTPLGGALGGVFGPRPVFGEVGLLRKLGVAGMLGLSVAWRGTYAWAECDPVWCAFQVFGSCWR